MEIKYKKPFKATQWLVGHPVPMLSSPKGYSNKLFGKFKFIYTLLGNCLAVYWERTFLSIFLPKKFGNLL